MPFVHKIYKTSDQKNMRYKTERVMIFVCLVSEFQITIPCTGQKTGSPLMKIVLDITDSRGRPIQGSPLKLLLKKRCIAFGMYGHASFPISRGAASGIVPGASLFDKSVYIPPL